jgi:hypothetical protein
MQQYARRAAAAPGHPATNAALRASASSLAFTQHALPTIVTPFGIAVLVVALRLRPGGIAVVEILALTALVLALDLLAMLPADRILKGPLVASTPNIMGAVMNVLQMALGVAVLRRDRLDRRGFVVASGTLRSARGATRPLSAAVARSLHGLAEDASRRHGHPQRRSGRRRLGVVAHVDGIFDALLEGRIEMVA